MGGGWVDSGLPRQGPIKLKKGKKGLGRSWLSPALDYSQLIICDKGGPVTFAQGGGHFLWTQLSIRRKIPEYSEPMSSPFNIIPNGAATHLAPPNAHPRPDWLRVKFFRRERYQ